MVARHTVWATPEEHPQTPAHPSGLPERCALVPVLIQEQPLPCTTPAGPWAVPSPRSVGTVLTRPQVRRGGGTHPRSYTLLRNAPHTASSPLRGVGRSRTVCRDSGRQEQSDARKELGYRPLLEAGGGAAGRQARHRPGERAGGGLRPQACAGGRAEKPSVRPPVYPPRERQPPGAWNSLLRGSLGRHKAKPLTLLKGSDSHAPPPRCRLL